jgi:hypothetical protein
MLRLLRVPSAFLALSLVILTITPAYTGDYKAVALIDEGSGGPVAVVKGKVGANAVNENVQNKSKGSSLHGQATVNAYVEAHCSAASDAVALGAAFSGACGGARAAIPGPVRN